VSAKDQNHRDSLGIDASRNPGLLPARDGADIQRRVQARLDLPPSKNEFPPDRLAGQSKRPPDRVTKDLGAVNENPWHSEATRIRQRQAAQIGGRGNNNLRRAGQRTRTVHQGLRPCMDSCHFALRGLTDNKKLNQASLPTLKQKAPDQYRPRGQTTGQASRTCGFPCGQSKAGKT